MRKRFFVSGLVQGVGFRWSCVSAAKQIGVVGWTQNLSDGRVEVLAQGSVDQLRALEQWLHTGPSGAAVEAVETVAESMPVDNDSEIDDFRVRR